MSNLFSFSNPLCAIGHLYVLILFARAIVSWFPPPSSGSPLVAINRFLYAVTEPVLAPFRRMIPAMGMFDISFLIVFLLLEILVVPILCNLIHH